MTAFPKSKMTILTLTTLTTNKNHLMFGGVGRKL